MGNAYSIPKIHFEELQVLMKSQEPFLLINTMSEKQQDHLIYHTVSITEEETKINKLLRDKRWSTRIIVYGKNYNDASVIRKKKQLTQLGFKNVQLYIGGMFEWLCLQEIYGDGLFPTTSSGGDLLKYK